MRLHLLLPKVDPKAIVVPSKCAYADWGLDIFSSQDSL
jgi:hypothetical protein